MITFEDTQMNLQKHWYWLLYYNFLNRNYTCYCSYSTVTDSMCRQDSATHLSAEEEIAAEESLSSYCKPVELYNILQRRAVRNVMYLHGKTNICLFIIRANDFSVNFLVDVNYLKNIADLIGFVCLRQTVILNVSWSFYSKILKSIVVLLSHDVLNKHLISVPCAFRKAYSIFIFLSAMLFSWCLDPAFDFCLLPIVIGPVTFITC